MFLDCRNSLDKQYYGPQVLACTKLFRNLFGDGCYDKYVFYRNQNSTSSAVSIFTKDVIAGRKYLAVFDV
jgi:hypothetical protein